MMFMRFPIDAVFMSKPGRTAGPDGEVGPPQAAGVDRVSCRWCVARDGVLELLRSGRNRRERARRSATSVEVVERPRGRAARLTGPNIATAGVQVGVQS